VERRTRLHLLIALAISFTALAAHARVFMTQQQALASAFPGAKVTRESIFLTPRQLAAAKRESGLEFSDQLVVPLVTGTKTSVALPNVVPFQ